jgi:3-oxoacyl-[acyl-carrier protein] reductase
MNFENDKRLSNNRTAVILGGSEGIGFGCAKSLASNGHNIVIFSRSKDKLLNAKRELEKDGVNVQIYAGDISSQSSLNSLFSNIEMNGKVCDILINNNSGPASGSMLDLHEKDWVSIFESHVMPFFRAIKLVTPGMIDRKWGRIITIGSVAAKEPIENLDLSNFIRAGFVSINKTLSKRLAINNICTHFVCPGSIMTNRSRKLIEVRAHKMNISFNESLEMSESKIPMGRLGDPNDVGELVAFLCSEKAGYMTGNVIQVDGGLTKGII